MSEHEAIKLAATVDEAASISSLFASLFLDDFDALELIRIPDRCDTVLSDPFGPELFYGPKIFSKRLKHWVNELNFWPP